VVLGEETGFLGELNLIDKAKFGGWMLQSGRKLLQGSRRKHSSSLLREAEER
jgi:hypothetical protein